MHIHKPKSRYFGKKYFLQICCPPADIILLPDEFEQLSNATDIGANQPSEYDYGPPPNFDVSDYYEYQGYRVTRYV